MKTEQLHSHISYTLEEGDRLSDLGLKTLQSRPVTGSIVPGRLMINGSIRLVYPTEEMSSVSMLLSRLTQREALRIFGDLARVLGELEDTAFLDKRYIDLEPEHIYVSQVDENTRFVILPVETRDGALSREHVKELFNALVSKCQRTGSHVGKFLTLAPGIDDSQSDLFAQLTEADVIDAVKESFSDMIFDAKEQPEEVMMNPVPEIARNVPEEAVVMEDSAPGTIEEVELRYRGVYGAFAFFDRKEEFIIGKELTNDGILSSNPAVSRRHCKIINAGTCSFVEDMGSKNGTFVNERNLVPGQRARLNTGDRLQIADMCFDVVIHTR